MRPMTLAVARSLAASPSLAATGVPGAPDRSAVDRQHAWLTTRRCWAIPPTRSGSASSGPRSTRAGVESTYTVVGQPAGQRRRATRTRPPSPDTAYRYRVIAFNAAGEAMSNSVTVGPRCSSRSTPSPRPPAWAAPSTPSTPDNGCRRVGQRRRSRSRRAPDSRSLTSWSTASRSAPRARTSFTGVANDHTIWALFAPDTYSIVPSAGPNGSISPDTTQTVTSGSDITFTITPDVGYHVRC